MSTQDLPNIPPGNGQPKPERHNFNVTLSEPAYRQLEAVAKVTQSTKVQVIRRLIQLAAEMHVHHIPVCVNGGRCYTPQSHPPPAPAPHQTIMPDNA